MLFVIAFSRRAAFDPRGSSSYAGAPATLDAARVDLLTDREHDVLRLMARGATNAEIAARLHLAETTVKSHVGSIFTKLRVRDRAAAIVFAYDHGVVSPGSTPTPTDQ
jgi:DNA-binding NarL/FixJ family response regulator